MSGCLSYSVLQVSLPEAASMRHHIMLIIKRAFYYMFSIKR